MPKMCFFFCRLGKNKHKDVKMILFKIHIVFDLILIMAINFTGCKGKRSKTVFEKVVKVVKFDFIIWKKYELVIDCLHKSESCHV